MTAKTPGQLNFEAYDQAHGVRSPATWNHLGETERAGFDDGAQAVLNDAFPGLRKQRDEARDALARVLGWFRARPQSAMQDAEATRAQLARAYHDAGLPMPNELRRFL